MYVCIYEINHHEQLSPIWKIKKAKKTSSSRNLMAKLIQLPSRKATTWRWQQSVHKWRVAQRDAVRMLESNWSVYKRTKWFMQQLEGCLGQVSWRGSNDKGFINLKLTNFKREDDNENLKSDDCRNNGEVETRKERAQVFTLFGMFLYQGWRYYGALPIFASSSHSWQQLTSTLFSENQDLKDH